MGKEHRNTEVLAEMGRGRNYRNCKWYQRCNSLGEKKEADLGWRGILFCFAS